MQSIDDLISAATLYRADNVVVDPLVGRKPMNVFIILGLYILLRKKFIASNVRLQLHNYKKSL